MKMKRLLKASNSKNDLVKAILMYQKGLAYYMEPNHWVQSYEGKHVWNHPTDKDPTKVAKMVLGIKDEPVREPDKKQQEV